MPLESFRTKYNDFAKEQDVIKFFEQEIYSQLGLLETQKQEVLAYLCDYFQQQGFMFPVSQTIACTLMAAGKANGYGLSASDKDFRDQHINITANAEGLTIQELVEITQLTYNQDKIAAKFTPDNPEEKPYVIKAEGTLHFNFKDNASDPVITVKSNKISLGRADLEPLLSPSDFLTKIWDFIARVCGFHKVEIDDEASHGPHM